MLFSLVHGSNSPSLSSAFFRPAQILLLSLSRFLSVSSLRKNLSRFKNPLKISEELLKYSLGVSRFWQ